jgi:DNA invertase Pin-like site-specific DNA recombinase
MMTQPVLDKRANHKILSEHCDRLAIVYVRQSTLRQVQCHQESTHLQYGLVDQAHRLGWPRERITVIDEDQGLSGASAENRQGFQKLLGEVALNHVGLILGVEMSRLARSCKDWYQLLELCAVFGTLISDLDGLYDPANYNDRLLLGLKGTMSEAELHILKQRMRQGALQKARRGELFTRVPIGYVRDHANNVVLDPDEQARSVVHSIFEQFSRLGSASAVQRWLVTHQVKFPVRIVSGPRKGELDWRRPYLTTLRNMLTHPIYAGAYVYGRTCQNPTTRRVRGVSKNVPREQWQVLLRDKCPSYITWEQFESNVEQLKQNRSRSASRGAVRQGRALLAGLIKCGRCGFRMRTRYTGKASQPRYACETSRSLHGDGKCQSVTAKSIDDEVVRLALLALEPSSLEVSLHVAADIDRQREQAKAQWVQQLERATFEADRARRQYDVVEPENRLVARSLEQEWEGKLGTLEELRQRYQQFEHEQLRKLTDDEQDRIRLLAMDLPRLWASDHTTDEDRKIILRQVIDQVAVNVEGDTEWVEVRVNWAGGNQTYSRVRRPVGGSKQLSRWPQLVERLQALKANGLSAPQIAERLNQEGFRPAQAKEITPQNVRVWLCRHGLTNKRMPLPTQLSEIEWTIPGLIARYGLSTSKIHGWIKRGQVVARQISGPGSRWIITAEREHIETLIRKGSRRKQVNAADETNTDPSAHAREAVTGGTL